MHSNHAHVGMASALRGLRSPGELAWRRALWGASTYSSPSRILCAQVVRKHTFCFRVVAFLVVIFLISACLMRLYSSALILELLYRSHKQTNIHMFSCRFRYHFGSIAKYNFGPLRHPLLFAHALFLGSSMGPYGWPLPSHYGTHRMVLVKCMCEKPIVLHVSIFVSVHQSRQMRIHGRLWLLGLCE